MDDVEWTKVDQTNEILLALLHELNRHHAVAEALVVGVAAAPDTVTLTRAQAAYVVGVLADCAPWVVDEGTDLDRRLIHAAAVLGGVIDQEV